MTRLVKPVTIYVTSKYDVVRRQADCSTSTSGFGSSTVQVGR